MKLIASILGAAAFALSFGAVAQNEQFIPANFYWVGPYAPGGSGFGGGIIDYLQMLNERDGGINGAAYLYNSGGVASYTARLEQLNDRMTATQSFDPAAKLSSSATLKSFASSSAAWLEEARRTAGDEADYRNTLLERSSDALSKVTGVNLDEEMTLMLELERTYQASSKLISTIDSMLGALLAAVR